MWEPNHPALVRFKAKRCSTVDEVREWVEEEKNRERELKKDTDEHGLAQTDTDEHGPTRTDTDGDTGKALAGPGEAAPCSSVPSSVFVANGALSLLNLTCYLLDRQLAAQAASFEQEGGFTERLYRIRQDRRRGK